LCASERSYSACFILLLHDPAPTKIYTLSPTRRSSDLIVNHSGPSFAASTVAHATCVLARRGQDQWRKRRRLKKKRKRLNPRAKADRKSTRLNSSHLGISYAVFCLKKKKKTT